MTRRLNSIFGPFDGLPARVVFCLLVFFIPQTVGAQAPITTPLQQFGHAIGDDYRLVNYSQLVEYWKKLDQESDRLSLVEIGRTAEDRPMFMAIVTSAVNQQ